MLNVRFWCRLRDNKLQLKRLLHLPNRKSNPCCSLWFILFHFVSERHNRTEKKKQYIKNEYHLCFFLLLYSTNLITRFNRSIHTCKFFYNCLLFILHLLIVWIIGKTHTAAWFLIVMAFRLCDDVVPPTLDRVNEWKEEKKMIEPFNVCASLNFVFDFCSVGLRARACARLVHVSARDIKANCGVLVLVCAELASV